MCYKTELVQVLIHLPFYKIMLEKGQTASDENFKRHTLFLKNVSSLNLNIIDDFP